MLATAAQYSTDSSSGGIFSGGLLIFWLIFLVIYVVSAWKVWEKMGDPGWMGIVPFLNYYRVFQRSRPDQAILFSIGAFFCCLLGFVGLVDLAKLFGKEVGFALGLIFLPFIFLPILAFGSAQYVGPPAPRLG